MIKSFTQNNIFASMAPPDGAVVKYWANLSQDPHGRAIYVPIDKNTWYPAFRQNLGAGIAAVIEPGSYIDFNDPGFETIIGPIGIGSIITYNNNAYIIDDYNKETGKWHVINILETAPKVLVDDKSLTFTENEYGIPVYQIKESIDYNPINNGDTTTFENVNMGDTITHIDSVAFDRREFGLIDKYNMRITTLPSVDNVTLETIGVGPYTLQIKDKGVTYSKLEDVSVIETTGTLNGQYLQKVIIDEKGRTTGVETFNLGDYIMSEPMTSEGNKLVNQDWVNSSITAMSARALTYDANGNPFPTKADLDNATTFYYKGLPSTPSDNDYVIVLDDETHDGGQVRYGYESPVWVFRYKINDRPFTSAQMAAINSTITEDKVNRIVYTDTDQAITGIKSFSNQTQFNSQVILNANLTVTGTNRGFWFNNNRLQSVATPIGASDAANKQYVDDAVSGITPSIPVATNHSLGIVKGTDSVNGRVHVETDGSLTVTGWANKVEDATIGEAAVPKSGTTLQLPAYPTLSSLTSRRYLPAGDGTVSYWGNLDIGTWFYAGTTISGMPGDAGFVIITKAFNDSIDRTIEFRVYPSNEIYALNIVNGAIVGGWTRLNGNGDASTARALISRPATDDLHTWLDGANEGLYYTFSGTQRNAPEPGYMYYIGRVAFNGYFITCYRYNFINNDGKVRSWEISMQDGVWSPWREVAHTDNTAVARVIIPSYSDLNNYTIPGFYYNGANVETSTMSNIPEPQAFSMVVLDSANTTQIWYSYYDPSYEWRRRLYNGDWTAWVRQPRMGDLAKYLQLTGGERTIGNINVNIATQGTYPAIKITQSGPNPWSYISFNNPSTPVFWDIGYRAENGEEFFINRNGLTQESARINTVTGRISFNNVNQQTAWVSELPQVFVSSSDPGGKPGDIWIQP